MRPKKFLAYSTLVFAWCYFVFLATLLSLRFMFEDRWWWLGLLNSLTVWWFVPLIVVVPIAFATRRRSLWLGSAICTIIF
jgi:hypothetical protein